MVTPKKKGESAKANGKVPTPAQAEVPAQGYFRSLSVENVRCFGPKQTLDLSDGHGKPAPWTIILGLNGTGKTTLLQALVGFEFIHSSLQADTYPRFLDWRREATLNFTRHQGKMISNLSVDLISTNKLVDLPSQLHGLKCSIELVTLGVSLDCEPAKPRVLPHSICAYGASRRVGSSSLKESPTDDPTASLFSDTAELRNPEEWLVWLDYSSLKNEKFQESQKKRLSDAKHLLLNIFPEGEISDIRMSSQAGTNPKPRVEFKTRYGWVPLRSLGYGYQTLITWVTDLVNRMVERYPDSPNPLAEPAIVVVDEIDLHLHPQWQRKLMSFLTERFPNTQFIATAHSPLVVQAAADANLAVLRSEGDHVVIDNDVDNIRGWRIDQILTSDLFGLETARPPQIEPFLLERKALLTQAKLSAVDKRRLEKLEAKIGNLPAGETAQQIKEREDIRKTLDRLEKERLPAR